jgi:hypothetical protein
MKAGPTFEEYRKRIFGISMRHLMFEPGMDVSLPSRDLIFEKN